MSLSLSYGFDTELDYTLSNCAILSSKARLAIVPSPEQLFAQDFASDVGFTYDNTKAEFNAGILRQKDLRPVSSVLAATYTSSKNLNWSTAGSLVGTDIGAPLLSAGKLSCLGGGNNGVRYESADIGASGNVGAMKIKYTPNYSGTPATNYNIFEFAPVSGNNDRMLVFHSATGTLRLSAYTSVGTAKHAAVPFGGVWSPVAGTEYEIELDWDTVAGVVRLFVNGVLNGSMPVSSYARGSDADRLYIGAGTSYFAADGYFDDALLFSTVQHTAGYTPGYTLPEFIYGASKIDGPNFTYSGLGSVLSIDDGSVVETGSPRFIIGLKYWNGSAWVVSNGTYAQANSFATALANLASFVASGSILPWSVVFTDSNTQSSVDDFDVEVTGQKYSPTGYLEPAQGVQVKTLISYLHTHTENANTDLRVVLKVDGVLKWWNGTAWATSNGSIAQGNTAEEINLNMASLSLGVNSTIFVRWLMATSSNVETPEIETATIAYNFGAIETPLVTCEVFGYLKNISDAPVVGAKIKFELNQKPEKYKEANKNIISTLSVEATTDANGYFTIPLVRSSEYEDATEYKATITIGTTIITKSSSGKLLFQVPDADTKDLSDLLPAVA